MSNSVHELVAQTGRIVLLAGASGLVGQAIVRCLMGAELRLLCPSHAELDLTLQQDVEHYMAQHRPDVLIIAAGQVGGIGANQQFPADFCYNNLMINANLLRAAYLYQVKRVLVLGSSCIYPKFATQPIAETQLLAGALEPTNDAYAIAKIAALKLAHSYLLQYQMDIRALMPTNLYGPGDRFDEQRSHVVPAMMLRLADACQAKQPNFDVWGSGTPRREFLHVDDFANAIIEVLALPCSQYRADWLEPAKPQLSEFFYNVGSGSEVSISELAQVMCEISDFKGTLRFLTDKPDGTPRKRLDCSRLYAMSAWRPRLSLHEGLTQTWQWYLTERKLNGAQA